MNNIEIKNKDATDDNGPVQAYAKLEGEDFCYYIRTLQVTLGRKVKHPENVDIPLGNTKSVSRQHARLFYNFNNQRFEMIVFGKNGAFVNEQFIEKGVTVPLENRTKIQIGEVSFIFLLPRVDLQVNELQQQQHDTSGYISAPQQLQKKRRKSEQKAVIETTATAIEDEYSDDNIYHSKDIKPPYSYASLIAQAINSTYNKRMTLNGIYTFITTRYPYYQMTQNGWQNSIRHNLSLNKAFIKVPRGDAEPGKGAFWTIDQTAENQFSNGVYKKNKRPSTSKEGSSERKRLRLENGNGEDDDESGEEEDDDDEAGERHDVEEDDEDDEREETINTIVAATADEMINSTLKTSQQEDKDVEKKVKQEEEVAVKVEDQEVVKETPVSKQVKQEVVEETKPLQPQIKNTELQNQLQNQLQTTIRQHLLDPVKHPLPSSIVQLLPQAIAQLPPQLAGQLSSTLQSALKSNTSNK